MSNFITIKHSMPAGDLLSLMPSFKHLYETTGRKSVIYQRINLEYGDMYGAYPGATYSIKNLEGVPVTMNVATFHALRPLLEAQEYIEAFKEWEGEDVIYDMDWLRQMDTTMPYGSISTWPSFIWPEMAPDLTEQWLKYPKETSQNVLGKIMVNRTERYTNMLISYQFLKPYETEVLFVGLPHEHEIFCRQNKLNVVRYDASDFQEIAAAMTMCKMFIGNQSSLYQISEGLKIPRILEVCRQIPNVIGYGDDCYAFLNQKSLEYYFNKLYNE